MTIYSVMKKAVLIGLLVVTATALHAQDKLAAEFASPPDEARPHTWWHWMNGNISREGITADLEAMKRAGIRGATIFNVDQQVPPGPVKFLSEPWWEMNLFAAQEAKRLGLTLGVANCAGWSSSGGPWVTPEHAMKMVVTSETVIHGGGPVQVSLPQPPTLLNYYRDIAVLAFPRASLEAVKMTDFQPKITASVPDFDGAALLDASTKTMAALPVPAPDKPQYIQIEFPEPYTVRSVELLPGMEADESAGELQSSADGVTYKKVAALPQLIDRYLQPWESGAMAWQRFGVPETTARFFRLVFLKSGSRWRTLSLAELELSPSVRIDNPAGKTFRQPCYGLTRMGEKLPAGQVIDPEMLIDLTDKFNKKGQLNWDPPVGEWVVLRIGFTAINRNNHPAPQGGGGLEIDKLSREAAHFHWSAYVEKLKQKFGPLWGSTVNEVLIDSYEVGMQTWTPKFREEFRRRRGYDLIPWMPALTGRIISNVDLTERFLWDYRLTLADLMAENYYDTMAELARKSGVKLASEPYGNGPFEGMRSGRNAGIIMGEFWVGDANPVKENLRTIAATAHIYGKRIVGAEALTSRTKWADHPRLLKPYADIAFANGINYFELHRFVHQPWMKYEPGLSLGPFGSHLDRTNTWWEQSGGWIDYLARCQLLLQQGLPVVDGLYFTGEGAPTEAWTPLTMPVGYAFDRINADALLTRVSTKDGRLVLPDGMSYRVLVLPARKMISPEILRKLKTLAEAGALIIGPKTETAPGFSSLAQREGETRQLAAEIWGNGRIRDAKSMAEVLDGVKLPPDFECDTPTAKLTWTHRSASGREIYFVANGEERLLTTNLTFRVRGKVPEFWYADTGRTERVALYTEVDGRTRVSVRLDPHGSLFVVFREASSKDHPISFAREGAATTDAVFPDGTLRAGPAGRTELETWTQGRYTIVLANGGVAKMEVTSVPAPVEIKGPWQVQFQSGRGAPAAAVTFEKLIPWNEHSDSGVKYFSGTATYRVEVDLPDTMIGPGRRVYLDLGRVEVLAGVKCNGRDLGVAWKKPYVVELTGAAKAGRNELELTVTNLWPNRMIGDEQLADDSPRERESLKQWPDWVLKGQPSPTGRFSFASWRFYKKDNPLLPSGLIGPVRVMPSVTQTVVPSTVP